MFCLGLIRWKIALSAFHFRKKWPWLSAPGQLQLCRRKNLRSGRQNILRNDARHEGRKCRFHPSKDNGNGTRRNGNSYDPDRSTVYLMTMTRRTNYKVTNWLLIEDETQDVQRHCPVLLFAINLLKTNVLPRKQYDSCRWNWANKYRHYSKKKWRRSTTWIWKTMRPDRGKTKPWRIMIKMEIMEWKGSTKEI